MTAEQQDKIDSLSAQIGARPNAPTVLPTGSVEVIFEGREAGIHWSRSFVVETDGSAFAIG